MITSSNNDKIYIGRNAGKELLELIKSAKKSVKIVSPYLSSSYVKELIELSKRGREVMLITCDKIVDERSRYSDVKTSDLVKEKKILLPENEKTRKRGVFIGLMVFLLSLILFPVGFLMDMNEIMLSVSVIIFVISVIILGYYYLFVENYRIEYEPIFRMKVFDSHSGKNPLSTELVHSKIYIIDEERAYLGSANFSYSGFKTHYETLIEIKDNKAIKDISDEVERLYSSNDFKAKDIGEWV